MKQILSIPILLVCLLSCKPHDIVIQTYSNMDSATGSYAGHWEYIHAKKTNAGTTRTNTVYTDTVVVSKISNDSIAIDSKMGLYRFKFDGVSNTYTNSSFMTYSINTVAHSLSAIEKYSIDSNANYDSTMYSFIGNK